MPIDDHESEIAAFIGTRGVTHCTTACAAPTKGSGSAADRAALRGRAEHRERLRCALASLRARGARGLRRPVSATADAAGLSA
jgi:hypothetical protein